MIRRAFSRQGGMLDFVRGTRMDFFSKRRIKCVNVSEHPEYHRRIASIGCLHTDGTPVKISHDDAVHGILNNQWIFDAEIGGNVVVVTLGTGPQGERYLKGWGDGDSPETLLKLPRC
jgi:hypothetical protein